MQRGVVTALSTGLDLVVIYATVGIRAATASPTRGRGASRCAAFLLTTVKNLGLGVADAIPGLFTVPDHLRDRTLHGPADRVLVHARREGRITPSLDLSRDGPADAPAA